MPNMVLVLASEFKKELVNLGISSNKIKITTTMVESEKYKPKIKKFNKNITVLFCGRIKVAKGIYELLDAIPIILDKHPETKFIYMGNGSEFNNLYKKIKEIKLSKNVDCIGHKSGNEKIKTYQNSNILVLPSYSEGFPNVFCEAMSAGLPIIATPKGGLADVLKDGKQGLIIKSMPPKPDDIAEKIIKLIKNPVLMKKMSQNNLKEAKEKYDVNVVCEEIGKIYEEILLNEKKVS